MDAAATGITEKENREQGIDEQDIFYGVVLFLAAITLGLLRRGVGADDAPVGPCMGKRGSAGGGSDRRQPGARACVPHRAATPPYALGTPPRRAGPAAETRRESSS